jgi:porphobilinogen deaminase
VKPATLRLGSRRSPMAIAQSGEVARLITERTGRPVEIVGVTTFGDVTREQLTQIGGTGVFVSALRESLLRGQVDFAVHSLKDLPMEQPPGITLAAAGAERPHLRGVVLGRPVVGSAGGTSGTIGIRGTIGVRECGEAEAAAAERLGRDLAARMLARGAANLIGTRTDRDDAHD